MSRSIVSLAVYADESTDGRGTAVSLYANRNAQVLISVYISVSNAEVVDVGLCKKERVTDTTTEPTSDLLKFSNKFSVKTFTGQRDFGGHPSNTPFTPSDVGNFSRYRHVVSTTDPWTASAPVPTDIMGYVKLTGYSATNDASATSDDDDAVYIYSVMDGEAGAGLRSSYVTLTAHYQPGFIYNCAIEDLTGAPVSGYLNSGFNCYVTVLNGDGSRCVLANFDDYKVNQEGIRHDLNEENHTVETGLTPHNVFVINYNSVISGNREYLRAWYFHRRERSGAISIDRDCPEDYYLKYNTALYYFFNKSDAHFSFSSWTGLFDSDYYSIGRSIVSGFNVRVNVMDKYGRSGLFCIDDPHTADAYGDLHCDLHMWDEDTKNQMPDHYSDEETDGESG